MNQVMIDLETLGNGKSACIVQIGARYFDLKTGELGTSLSINVDPEDKDNGQIDASTVKWWLFQSREAIDSVFNQPYFSFIKSMEKLNSFLCGAEEIWSHATFDFVIVSESLKRIKMKPEFSYRAARDIRTLVSLAKYSEKFDSPKRQGIHHNALDDCDHQIKYCANAYRKLMQ